MRTDMFKTLLTASATLIVAISSFSMLSATPARAACANPVGAAGDMLYNVDSSVLQYCDDTDWIGMSGAVAPSVIDDLSDVSTGGKAVNDVLTWDGTDWIAQAVVPSETDPQVGTLTATKWCTANAGGTFIDCTSDIPAGDNLGNHTATTDLDMATNNIDNAGTVTADTFLHSSDARLKENIETVANPFDLLEAISGKHYTWKKDGSPAYGVIAQDVETVMPEAVYTHEDTGMKAVDYDQLLAPLIEAVKAQNMQIKAQQAQIEALQGRVKILKEGGPKHE